MPSAEDASKLWTIPLVFATASGTTSKAELMTSKRQEFTIPLLHGSNDWVKLNAGQKALVRVAYTPEMTRRLQSAIVSGTLPVVDRAALLLDAYAIAKAGLGPVEAVVDLLRAYNAETNSTVFSAISVIIFLKCK